MPVVLVSVESFGIHSLRRLLSRACQKQSSLASLANENKIMQQVWIETHYQIHVFQSDVPVGASKVLFSQVLRAQLTFPAFCWDCAAGTRSCEHASQSLSALLHGSNVRKHGKKRIEECKAHAHDLLENGHLCIRRCVALDRAIVLFDRRMRRRLSGEEKVHQLFNVSHCDGSQ